MLKMFKYINTIKHNETSMQNFGLCVKALLSRRVVPEAYLKLSRTSTMEPFCENSIQFSRYILREIPPMTCKVLARNLLSSKKLHIGYIVTFQRNIELYFEYNLDSYNFFELKKMIQNAKIIYINLESYHECGKIYEITCSMCVMDDTCGSLLVNANELVCIRNRDI